MDTVTIKIANKKKLKFILELLNNFDFVTIVEQKSMTYENQTEQSILEDIRQGYQEVKAIERGEGKAVPLKDFLDEL